MADLTSSRGVPASEIMRVLMEHEKENNAFIRHYEDVRFKITQINVTLSVLLVGASRFGTSHASKILLSTFIFYTGDSRNSCVCKIYRAR
jgi:hypothetical protein